MRFTEAEELAFDRALAVEEAKVLQREALRKPNWKYDWVMPKEMEHIYYKEPSDPFQKGRILNFVPHLW